MNLHEVSRACSTCRSHSRRAGYDPGTSPERGRITRSLAVCIAALVMSLAIIPSAVAQAPDGKLYSPWIVMMVIGSSFARASGQAAQPTATQRQPRGI